MDIESIYEEYVNLTSEELVEIQDDCFITIRAALAELSKHIDQNINQIFFLMCILSCILDGDTDEKEFTLVKRYVGSTVTYPQYKDYASKYVNNESLEKMIIDFISIVKQFSKESVVDFVKFIVCFMSCKGYITDKEKNFIGKIVVEEKAC